MGSAVGMQLFASNIIENCYVVYDADHMPADIERAIQFLKKEDVTKLLFLQMCDEVSYKLFIIDSGGIIQDGFWLCQRFFMICSIRPLLLTIIDVTVDFPRTVITYIESGACSASELVTELIQFQNSKKNRLSRMQASVLMAGMMP